MRPAEDLTIGTASMAKQPPFKPLPQRSPDVSVERRADGVILVRSNYPPGDAPRSIGHLLAEKAREHPDRPYILQRAPNHGAWGGVSYSEAKRAADGVAQWLLDAGLGSDDAVVVLSGNSVEHGLLMLGCYTAGVPIAPISPAYSLVSQDHGKLRHAFALLKPKVVFAQDSKLFARAFDTLRRMDPDVRIVTVDGGDGTMPLSELTSTQPGPGVAEALDKVSHSTTAKYLFTSGSTGMPKCVPQTHGMFAGLIAGHEGLRTDKREPEQVRQTLEWMPWSHISAGNISFNDVLWYGGTLYLDEGKPLPGPFETTIKNLYEVSPVVFGAVPIAFTMLTEAMERDPVLRASFFRNLSYMGYGGATLSTDVYERLQALAVAETGYRIPITTMYGATETQGVTVVHWPTERVGLIGLPVPGIELKLVPNGGKLEVRAKGPTIMTGYYGDPEKTAAAFDDEGFYRLGDAARFLDPESPELGLVFDGRVTEDFKLDSGTWVSVGTLRPDVVAACSPFVQDLVLTGQDMPFLGALIWPAAAALASLGDDEPMNRLETILSERLRAFNATAGGSSRRIGRFLLLTEPPSIDAGEITDKGYVNQRATLERRRELVERLYAEPSSPGVVQL